MRILIIGGGPAGLSAAYNAAKQGHEVVLFEQNSDFGEKPCAEALPRVGLRYVDKLLCADDFVETKYKGLVFSYQNKVFSRFEARDYIGYIIDKKKFLQSIADGAEKLGVKIHKPWTVEAVDPQKASLKAKGEIFSGDLVVCADGANSLAHSHLPQLKKKAAPCLQYKCKIDGDLENDLLHIEFFDNGYLWVFFKNEDFANVGIIRTSEKQVPMRRLLESYAKKVGAKPVEPLKGAIVPIGGPLKSFSNGKLVMVGDAAGHVNPISGEGIHFALYAGCICFLPDYVGTFEEKFGHQLRKRRRFLSHYQKTEFKDSTDRLLNLDYFVKLF